MRIVLLISLVVASAACGDPPPSDYPSQVVYVEDTNLGPGDVFDVRVYKQPELSSTYAASPEGVIQYPHIGEVVVTGKTPAELEKEIRDRLADGYLRDPQVSILVKEYKSKKVSVLGQVRSPGTLSFTEGMTVTDAVSQAGGFTAMARKNAVTVTRVVNETPTKYTVPVESIASGKAKNFYMRPGDTVFVPDRAW